MILCLKAAPYSFACIKCSNHPTLIQLCTKAFEFSFFPNDMNNSFTI